MRRHGVEQTPWYAALVHGGRQPSGTPASVVLERDGGHSNITERRRYVRKRLASPLLVGRRELCDGALGQMATVVKIVSQRI